MRKVLAIMSSAFLLFALAVNVSAGTQGAGCGGETAYAKLYENVVGDTSDGNDILNACVDLQPNLGNISHTLPGDCHASPLNKVTWNDCVSSIVVVQPSSYHFCGYRDSNYHTLIVDRPGLTGMSNIPSDQLSSYKMINLGPSGSCPAT